MFGTVYAVGQKLYSSYWFFILSKALSKTIDEFRHLLSFSTCGSQIVNMIYCKPLIFSKYFYFSQNQDNYFKAMRNPLNKCCNI